MWKMQLAHMMKENGMHIRSYINNCFVCDVHRDGRSDDDIDTIMRTMKIITTMVFFLPTVFGTICNSSTVSSRTSR